MARTDIGASTPLDSTVGANVATVRPSQLSSGKIKVKKNDIIQFKVLPEDDWTTAVVLGKEEKPLGAKAPGTIFESKKVMHRET